MKRFRWLWFIGAIVMTLTLPFDILAALELGRSDHRLIPIIPVAFAIRFAVIWWFFKLWWRYRPNADSGSLRP
jgi:hypothetical protein